MHFRKILIYCVLLILLFSFPVYAEDWKLISENQNAKFFIDISNSKITLGTTVYYEKGEFNTEQTKIDSPWNIPFLSYIAKRKINCNTNTVRNISVKTYNKDGKENIEYYFDPDNSTTNIKTGSIEAFVYNKVCNPQ
jgi:hypothetical protein